MIRKNVHTEIMNSLLEHPEEWKFDDNPKHKIIYHKNELNNLRYKISNATDFELIDSHQEKFNEFFEDFKVKVNELFALSEQAEVKDV